MYFLTGEGGGGVLKKLSLTGEGGGENMKTSFLTGGGGGGALAMGSSTSSLEEALFGPTSECPGILCVSSEILESNA
jgi:hypothetical protein